MKLAQRNQGKAIWWILIIVAALVAFLYAGGAFGGEVPVEAPTKTPLVTLQAGTTYDSLYMFRGIKSINGGLMSADATVTAFGISAYTWYAIGAQYKYQELDWAVSYSHDVGPVNLTGGINYYHYTTTDGGIPDTYELFGTASYAFLNYYTGSVTYYRDIRAIRGGYIEAKVAGDFPLVKKPITVDLQPYVLGSFDMKYNSEMNRWNSAQIGMSVSIGIGDHFSVAPYIAYSVPLAAIDKVQTEEWWFGARAQVSF